jgi:hypothetical protein
MAGIRTALAVVAQVCMAARAAQAEAFQATAQAARAAQLLQLVLRRAATDLGEPARAKVRAAITAAAEQQILPVAKVLCELFGRVKLALILRQELVICKFRG